MNKKKRYFSLDKKAQEESMGAYKMIIMIILALLLGFFLFMMIARWSSVFKP